MPDPKQLRVLKKLSDHLEGLNPDNVNVATGEPYTFDLRGRVMRGISVAPVDILEGKVAITEFPRQELFSPVGSGANRIHQWMLLVQGWPTDDPRNPSDPAYALKAEVETHLARLISERPNGRGPTYPEEFMLGEHNGQRELASFTLGPGVVRAPEDAVSRLTMFYVPLVLGIALDVTNPY